MSGIFDLHAVVVIRRDLGVILSDLTEFSALFQAVDPTVIAEWHAELLRTGVQVLTGFDHAPPQPPFVMVTLVAESPKASALGDFAGRDTDGAELRGCYVTQQISIGCWAKSAELARALSVLVRAAMLRSLPALLAAGYDSADYLGLDELSMEERLIAEASGMATRKARWAADSLVSIRDAGGPPAEISWWVQASDLTVAGNPGGVVPFRA